MVELSRFSERRSTQEERPTQGCALALFSMASVYHVYLVVISIIANGPLATLNLGKELERKARDSLPEARTERRPKAAQVEFSHAPRGLECLSSSGRLPLNSRCGIVSPISVKSMMGLCRHRWLYVGFY